LLLHQLNYEALNLLAYRHSMGLASKFCHFTLKTDPLISFKIN